MKKFGLFLFSMLFTGMLTVVFAVSIGYATFIENDYGTITAKILIYNSRWFEILLVLLGLNLIGSIITNKLYTWKKWPIFIFHIAFIFMLVGAALTRYFGYEGLMHIREGESTDYIISEETFIQLVVSDGDETVSKVREVMFSPYTSNRFSERIPVNGKTVHIKSLQYVPSAVETVVADPSGEPMISLMAVGSNMQRQAFNLKLGEQKAVDNTIIGFHAGDAQPGVHLSMEGNKLFVTASDTLFLLDMAGNQTLSIYPGIQSELNTQSVYSTGDIHFAVSRFFQKGRLQLTYSPSENAGFAADAVQLAVAVDDNARSLVVFGKKGMVGESFTTSVDGVNVTASFGSRKIELPVSIYLSDFQLERYPGSNSPSSFASEVILRDGETEKPYRIYMNNILNYKGYRFFQSSYDNDEKGTVLSVNSDAWGTSVTYLGYLMMIIGFFFTMFVRNSRFMKLVKASAKLSEDRKKLFAVIIFGFIAFSVSAQTGSNIQPLNRRHVAEFEELLLQSHKGRTEPAATMASEILRKVVRKNNWKGMPATEVFLHMQANPEIWKNEPIIKIANPDLQKMLGVSGGFASFNQIVLPRESGGYRLGQMVSAAFEKKSSERNKLDKEVINVDERVNIMMSVFTGRFFTVFPVPGHSNDKWVSVADAHQLAESGENFARQVTGNYLQAVARQDWGTASQLLNSIKGYQQKEGAAIIPSGTKIKLEILYHKWDIFGKLSKVLLTVGLILLILQIYTIFNPKKKLGGLRKAGFYIILFFFLIQTSGLIIRWYISGHAPWANGYESMIFLSWATLLAGILFVGRSEITLSLTTMLAGLTLLVAGFSWMSPEITNLVPVLQSYWLIVHVAIIMASYGFLGISAMLGLLNLILMIFRNPENERRINHTIKELVVIIHISLIIGLFMLAAGSFIGGVWANESWGRYWGWDPKETWAMVTILVYSFIVHMHKIPGFKGNFAVSAASLVGFGSVLMTYFGVNYYLSGMHSYAQGEPAPVPAGVYIGVILVLLLVSVAFAYDKKAVREDVVVP
jgi:cytochrome c-type biogenesis protein CcsB